MQPWRITDGDLGAKLKPLRDFCNFLAKTPYCTMISPKHLVVAGDVRYSMHSDIFINLTGF